ncbi:unnamed protein product [Cutaneotrichosporon oleaginosum]
MADSGLLGRTGTGAGRRAAGGGRRAAESAGDVMRCPAVPDGGTSYASDEAIYHPGESLRRVAARRRAGANRYAACGAAAGHVAYPAERGRRPFAAIAASLASAHGASTSKASKRLRGTRNTGAGARQPCSRPRPSVANVPRSHCSDTGGIREFPHEWLHAPGTPTEMSA